MAVTVVSPPAGEPVSLADLKQWLRVDLDWQDDDTLIQGLGKAARRLIERQYGMAICTQTLQLQIDRFPIPGNPCLWNQYPFGGFWNRIPMANLSGAWWPERAAVYVPYPPLQSVASIQYVDQAGTLQTLAPTSYQVDANRRPGRLTPVPGGFWPYTQVQAEAVSIQYVAGFDAPGGANVPEALKLAIKVAAHYWYENRAEPGKLPEAVDTLVSSEWSGEYN